MIAIESDAVARVNFDGTTPRIRTAEFGLQAISRYCRSFSHREVAPPGVVREQFDHSVLPSHVEGEEGSEGAIPNPVDRPGADGDDGRPELPFPDPAGHGLATHAEQLGDLGAGPDAFLCHAQKVAGPGRASSWLAMSDRVGLRNPRTLTW
jgi:hypothetical protein